MTTQHLRPPESSPSPKQSRVAAARVSLGRAFQAESGAYYLLLGTTLFLVLFGLVMVLSSSSIDSYTDRQGFFGVFWKQGLFAIVGIPLMLVVSRFPPTVWKRWAWLVLLVAVGMQLLVYTPLGYEIGGNRNWIRLGSITAQPSELIKLALVIWLAYMIDRKQHLLTQWSHVAVPIAPVAGGALGLVMLGGDLGTVMIIASIIMGALFFAGVKLRILAVPVIFGALAAALIAISSPSRLARLDAFFSTECTDYMGTCWQIQHGSWALAAGGVFGVGLGNSKSKWSWLPAADNDFIFAIIGEELGMIGAVVVLGLFIALGVAFLMILRGAKDMFARVVTGSVMVWVIGQAFVNIAVVLGVLPVLGVPLPLISSGGSALVTTLIGIGLVLSVARNPSNHVSFPTQRYSKSS